MWARTEAVERETGSTVSGLKTRGDGATRRLAPTLCGELESDMSCSDTYYS